MSGELGLFPAPAAAPVVPDGSTPGERRRARQLAAIIIGQHPLSVATRRPLALHVDARRGGNRDTPGSPRCGGCALRTVMSGAHEGRFPKCAADPIPASRTWPDGRVYRWNDYPWASNGPGTDVAAWWPACDRFEPVAAGPVGGEA